MRRFTVLIFAVVVLSAAAFMGVARADENDFKVTLSSRVWSKYVVGAGVTLHKDPVTHSSVDVLSPWGLYLNVWQSIGLDGTNPNSDFGDGIGYTIGWGGEAGQHEI